MCDKDGKYLYFTASTDSGASMEPDIHSSFRPVTRSVYLVVLAKDEPSPLAPESDDEKRAKKDEKRKTRARRDEAKKDDKKKDETKPTKSTSKSTSTTSASASWRFRCRRGGTAILQVGQGRRAVCAGRRRRPEPGEVRCSPFTASI